MTDFVQEFTDSAETVAKMMDLINRVAGTIRPIIIEINGIPMALTLQPVPQAEPVEETPAEEPAPEGEDAPIVEAPAGGVVRDAPVLM